MNKPDDLETMVSQQLDSSLDDIDPATLDKLKAARLKALLAAQAANPQNSHPENNHLDNVVWLSRMRHWPKTSLSLAASLLLAAPLWYFSTNNLPQPAGSVLSDTVPLAYSEESQLNTLDLISTYAELDDDELDMVDNLDFALWLVEQEAALPGKDTQTGDLLHNNAVNG